MFTVTHLPLSGGGGEEVIREAATEPLPPGLKLPHFGCELVTAQWCRGPFPPWISCTCPVFTLLTVDLFARICELKLFPVTLKLLFSFYLHRNVHHLKAF